ncbi:MAG: hypothetical protein ACU0GG_19345 [Paracoccaceae bacterium]
MKWMVFLGVFGLLAVTAGLVLRAPAPEAVDPDVSQPERLLAFQAARRADWDTLCAARGCDDIPKGYALETVGDIEYLLPLARAVVPETCEIQALPAKGHDYDAAGALIRAVDTHSGGLRFDVQCGEAAPDWAETLRFHRPFLVNAALVNDPAPQLPPSSSGAFVPVPSDDALGFVSNDALFQGRRVELTCAASCQVRSLVLPGEGTDASPLAARFSTALATPCAPNTILSDCPGETEKVLVAMQAFLIWLDAELDRARARAGAG